MVVVVLCILKGRTQRRAPLQALFKHQNDEQIQMKTDKKMARVNKSIFR
jgi:hypothetical protein